MTLLFVYASIWNSLVTQAKRLGVKFSFGYKVMRNMTSAHQGHRGHWVRRRHSSQRERTNPKVILFIVGCIIVAALIYQLAQAVEQLKIMNELSSGGGSIRF